MQPLDRAGRDEMREEGREAGGERTPIDKVRGEAALLSWPSNRSASSTKDPASARARGFAQEG